MRVLITIQEGQFSVAKLRDLEAIVRNACSNHLGTDKSVIIWNIAGEGLAYTNRKLSRSSLITLETPNGLDKTTREALLHDCDEQWRAATGQHPDQIMVAAFDQNVYENLYKGNLARFSSLGRFVFMLKTSFRLSWSKLRHGLLIMSFNL